MSDQPIHFFVEGYLLTYELAEGAAWPQDDRGALQAAIAKWQAIAAWHQGQPSDYAYPLRGVHGSTCALCKLHIKSGCILCPVMTRTGKSGCERTPYWYYVKAEDGSDLLAAALAEVEFLQSLLAELEAADA